MTLKPIKIRKLLVKDLPQVIQIQEIITKTKDRPQRRVTIGRAYSERKQPQFGGLG